MKERIEARLEEMEAQERTLRERLEAINRQRDYTLAQLNATVGAIQALRELLEEEAPTPQVREERVATVAEVAEMVGGDPATAEVVMYPGQGVGGED